MQVIITKRFFQPAEDSYFIFGPRETGKSTWIENNLPNALVINLLEDHVYRTYLSNPGYIQQFVLGNSNEHRTFVIDEVQKIPALLDGVHNLIEQKMDLQFVLTGSSSRKLKNSGVNLLAGRAILKECTHLWQQNWAQTLI